MRTTLARVNRALAAVCPGVTLTKGRGYFYFEGERVERNATTSVMVYRLNQLTLEEWIAQAARLVNAQANRAQAQSGRRPKP